MSTSATMMMANANGISPSIKLYFVAFSMMMLIATAVKTALEIVLAKLQMNIFFFNWFISINLKLFSRKFYSFDGNPNTLLAFFLAYSTSPSPLTRLA